MFIQKNSTEIDQVFLDLYCTGGRCMIRVNPFDLNDHDNPQFVNSNPFILKCIFHSFEAGNCVSNASFK